MRSHLIPAIKATSDFVEQNETSLNWDSRKIIACLHRQLPQQEYIFVKAAQIVHILAEAKNFHITKIARKSPKSGE